MQVERGSELTFASDKLRDASSHCSTVVRGLWIVAVLHAVLMGGYIWSGMSGRAVPLQDLGIALYDDYFGLGVIVVTLLSLSFSAGVAVWWLRWQCAIGRAAGHMGFMMRGWWNLFAWIIPGVNAVAPLVLVGRMARSMRANLPLLFLGAWWVLWLGLFWRQVQLIVEPRGEWTSEQAYFTALAMFLWLILDFTAMRVAMGLTVAGWRSLEKVSAERGATATEINVAVAGAREFSPAHHVSWSGMVRGQGSAIGRRVASRSKSALAAASVGTMKAAKKSKSIVESAAAARKTQPSAVTNVVPPHQSAVGAPIGQAEVESSVDASDEAVEQINKVTAVGSDVVDVSDSAMQLNDNDDTPDSVNDDSESDAAEHDDAEAPQADTEGEVVDLRDTPTSDIDDEAHDDDVVDVSDEVVASEDSAENAQEVEPDDTGSSTGHSLEGEEELATEELDETAQQAVVPEARKALHDMKVEARAECVESSEVADEDGAEGAASSTSVVRHSPRNADRSASAEPASHNVDEAIDGLVTRLSSVADATNDNK